MFFIVILHRSIFNWQISFLCFNFIGLMQCSKTLSVISSTDWERTIRAMKLHQYFEFGPSSQDPFSFCQIQLALNTVCEEKFIQKPFLCNKIFYPENIMPLQVNQTGGYVVKHGSAPACYSSTRVRNQTSPICKSINWQHKKEWPTHSSLPKNWKVYPLLLF